MAASSEARRASIIGTGLIGGSIGLGLRQAGWHVTGEDVDDATARQALDLGAIDELGLDAEAEITFVAVPVRVAAEEVRRALATTSGVVTDVGSVKAPLVAEVDDPRFVGGHPMAGSEQLGVEGSTPDMFRGAVWVLTPVADTDPQRFAQVGGVARSLGAEVVSLPPARHDALVAVVSHVPHLTAAALMSIADERADEHAALRRLAAGGFRDMTRIAAGTPTIWPDICGENRAAIVTVIDQLSDELARLRAMVDEQDHAGLLTVLERAQAARRNLPSRVTQPAAMAEVRIPVLDRGGVIAEVATLAAELDLNIADFEIAHSSEGDRGVLILVVDRRNTEVFHAALAERGYQPTVTNLE